MAGFWKNIKNGTFNSIVCPAAFNGTALSSNAAGDCVDSGGDIYEITATTNDPSKVKIRGYELGWMQSLDAWLPIDGFGVTTNFTRVIPQRDTDFQIRNLSEQTRTPPRTGRARIIRRASRSTIAASTNRTAATASSRAKATP